MRLSTCSGLAASTLTLRLLQVCPNLRLHQLSPPFLSAGERQMQRLKRVSPRRVGASTIASTLSRPIHLSSFLPFLAASIAKSEHRILLQRGKRDFNLMLKESSDFALYNLLVLKV